MAREFALWDRTGHPSGKNVSLGFGLRLDQIEIERAPVEFQFCVFAKGDKSWTVAESRGLAEAVDWAKAGSSGLSYRLVAAFPDFELRRELNDLPAGGGKPALQVQVFDGGDTTRTVILLAGVEGKDGITFKEGKSRLKFVWEESQLRVSTERLPQRHVLRVRRGGTVGHEEELVVEPGGRYSVADGEELTVHEWYPDLVFDSAKNAASTASADPNNPALRISVRAPGGTAQEGVVRANIRSLSGASGTGIGNVLVTYRFEPARPQPDREVVLIGSTRELLEYRNGILKSRKPFVGKAGEIILNGISALFGRMSASAEPVEIPMTRSNDWRKPVAQVEIRTATGVQTHYLKGGMPFDLGNGTEALVFQPKPQGVKAYRSHVSILSGENVIRQDVITSDSPLTHGGYRLSESGLREDDPTFSGILVVRDPELGMIYVGCALICLGAICRICLKPWLVRRRQKEVS